MTGQAETWMWWLHAHGLDVPLAFVVGGGFAVGILACLHYLAGGAKR